MPRPHISFFGIVTAKNSSGEKISLHGRKTSALLAYLLVTKREQSRDALANLFWPDLNEKDSKNNFRVALARISKRLGTTDKPFLLADRKTVQFNPEAIMDIDIHQFEKSINGSKIHEHNSRAGCASCCKALTKAVALYQAEFMQGFFLEGCDTYDEWQLLSREQYHLEALTALNDLSTFHETNGNYLEAEKHTRRQLSLEPLSEEAQRRLLRLLSFQDKRNAALEHFQSYQDYLLKELEVEPEDETVNLFHQIQTGMLEKPKLKNTPKTQMQPGIDELELRAGIHNLGTDTTPFFGREDEVLKLREYLAEKRLITILGIGGTGKTRLATELARTQINSFHDGVFALRLAPLQNPEDIPTVLAEALKFNFQQGADFKSQVLNQIKDKNMLFVMDNFEHLIEGRSIIQDILQAAPEIKIIVTSREKLNLSTEAAYKLSGLSYPNEGETQSEVVHSSTQLFIETAKWAQLDFKLDLLDLRHIDKICQIVQGHPLAIVLAASWLESLNCEEIVEELTESIEFLETDMHDVPERQRSIRAAFNYSWQLLSPEEQSIYASLSVFRGGFNRSAAKEVSGASLRQLTSLLNKSLIQHLPSQGRYELHELMRQFAEEKLIELGQGSHIKHQHSKYYLTTLQTLQEDFQLGNQVPSVKSFEADYENMRAAWQAAVSK